MTSYHSTDSDSESFDLFPRVQNDALSLLTNDIEKQ